MSTGSTGMKWPVLLPGGGGGGGGGLSQLWGRLVAEWRCGKKLLTIWNRLRVLVRQTADTAPD